MHVSIVNVCPASLHQSPLPSDKVFAPSRSDQKVDQLLMHNTTWQLVSVGDFTANCSHHLPLTTQGYNILYDVRPDKIPVKDLGTCRALPKPTDGNLNLTILQLWSIDKVHLSRFVCHRHSKAFRQVKCKLATKCATRKCECEGER